MKMMLLTGLLYISVTAIVVFADSTKEGWTWTYIRMLEESLQRFYNDVGRLPSKEEGLSVLVAPKGNMDGWAGPYSDRREIPTDRWGHELIYLYPPKYGSREYDLYSIGPNGIDDCGDNDDLANWKAK